MSPGKGRKKHRIKKDKFRRLKTREAILLSNTKHSRKFLINSIVYLEADLHGTIFHFSYDPNDFVLSPKNLGYWEKKLPLFFWRIHHHLLVNSKQSHDLDRSQHMLEVCGRYFRIAKRRYKDILKKYKSTAIH